MIDVAAIRKRAGLTQEEFGQRIGKNRKTIGSYETGYRVPKPIVESLIRLVFKEYLEPKKKTRKVNNVKAKRRKKSENKKT
jgi:transcriptional regulator with XRE-family HTH domain